MLGVKKGGISDTEKLKDSGNSITDIG